MQDQKALVDMAMIMIVTVSCVAWSPICCVCVRAQERERWLLAIVGINVLIFFLLDPEQNVPQIYGPAVLKLNGNLESNLLSRCRSWGFLDRFPSK